MDKWETFQCDDCYEEHEYKNENDDSIDDIWSDIMIGGLGWTNGEHGERYCPDCSRDAAMSDDQRAENDAWDRVDEAIKRKDEGYD